MVFVVKALVSPTIHELAERVHSIDPIRAGVVTNRHGSAFVEHRSTCESCNEV